MTAPPRRAERGAAVVELTLLTPVFVLLLLFVVGLGRLAQARGDLEGAARDAARAASIERTAPAAAEAARSTAAATLADRDITCGDLVVAVDTSSFDPGGSVVVDMACTVSFSDLSLLRLPGSRTLSARAVEVVDVFRGTG